MNRKLINSFVLSSKYESFLIDDHYVIPKNYNGHNIEFHRNKLLKDISSYCNSFIYDVSILTGKAVERKPLYNYIREFPIIIEDRDLWHSILTDLGEKGNSDNYEVGYFVLDFLFPTSDLVIEIDSPYHDSKKIYDQARDIYLNQVFGLDTVRFYEYGKDPEKREIYKKIFRNKIKSAYNRVFKVGLRELSRTNLDFSQTLIDNYVKKNKEALLFIDSLIRYFGKINFYRESAVKIKTTELKIIYPKIFKGPKGIYVPDDLFLGAVQIVIGQIYKKQLKLT